MSKQALSFSLLFLQCFAFICTGADSTVNINFSGLLQGLNSVSPPSPTPTSTLPPSLTQVNCDLAIVGAGVAGTHTAHFLADLLGDRICVFEAENQVGGRTQDGTGPNGETVPLGAIRVMESQHDILDLASTLGIELQFAPFQSTRILSRGILTDSQLSLKQQAFQSIKDNLTENDYWDQLRFSPKRQQASRYLNFKDYIREVIGNEQYNFLFSVYRFRGDLQNIDTRGYLDFLDEEWDVCCEAHYPVRGMSQFAKKFAERATQKGVRFFLNDAVTAINQNGDNITLTTQKHKVEAKRVVITATIDKVALLQGGVAKAIQEDPHFKALQPVVTVSINHIWPRRWWEEAPLFPTARRAWTSDNCLNFIEIPVHRSGIAENRTRTVYDDGLCSQQWAQILESQPLSLINERLVKMLRDIYPDVEIPLPTATYHKVWKAAWVFMNPNVPYTVRDVERWALRPLNDTRVHLVGENYIPRRASWIDGAVKSSWNFLEGFFELRKPNTTRTASKRSAERPPLSSTRA
eukprot:TRINITY_DN8404_c0_g1_i1.p1 TRINITY_DN8404_c0_g1~~TRINITY_DN8404_c0_g1_i1.p1  ORF type:complete len:521 (+),score=112.34 TRINITY_DN8404_c0_g1_i1:66-1628(+)